MLQELRTLRELRMHQVPVPQIRKQGIPGQEIPQVSREAQTAPGLETARAAKREAALGLVQAVSLAAGAVSATAVDLATEPETARVVARKTALGIQPETIP